ncbi:MAG: hypothetical protein PHX68_02510 [Alphaproteobacteria bacterium]|nr:hypothetical protein [Alphaproteobacteria bacterium]
MTPHIKPSANALSRLRAAHDNAFLTLVPRNSVVQGRLPLTSFAGRAVDYAFAKRCPRVLARGVEQAVCRYHAGLMEPGPDCLTIGQPDWDNPAGWCASFSVAESGLVRRQDILPGQKALRQEYDRGRFPIAPRVVAGRSLPIAHGGETGPRPTLIRRMQEAVKQLSL